jgi:hypothetical protein
MKWWHHYFRGDVEKFLESAKKAYKVVEDQRRKARRTRREKIS